MSWHAAAVHFPIALAVVAPWVDAVGLIRRKPAVSWTALALLGVAALGSVVATASGQADYDAAFQAGVPVEVLSTHSDWASLVPWALLGALGLRLWLPTRRATWGPWVGLLAMLACTPLVWLAGQTGGELVYHHAIGVEASAR